jgi:hypothetical protein
LMHKPQLTEPPDADPHVRWCGRGTAGIPGCPLSRLCPSNGSRRMVEPDQHEVIRL